jgi:nicotinamidase/pyrazinamidase
LKKNDNIIISKDDALIIADIQNDFLSNGSLPVKGGEEIIPVINEYVKMFKKAEATIIASRDWHPQNHVSFQSEGGPWPAHGIKDTEGAKFSPDLKLPKNTIIISKATNPSREAYSIFDETGLIEKLKEQEVSRIFICGLATDYGVVNSVLDARKLQLLTYVLVDATRGIEKNTGDIEKAIIAMGNSGANLVSMADFPDSDIPTQETNPAEIVADKSIGKFSTRKKARMRSKGAYKRLRRERG